ncbi:TRAP transporter small permease [Tropicimonas sp.]|uniref:TRAP transporter small permease n=1 Tax=Tropicimonas sp. TaxID=2067044 RepID=UPI003A85BF68
MLNRLYTVVVSAALGFMVLATAYSVFMRYVAGAPVHWMEEISGICMIWIVMVGAIIAERDDSNLSIPLFVDMLRPRGRALVNLMVGIVSIVLLIYIAWLGYVLASKVAFKLTGVLKISWYWIDIAVPVGAIGMAAYTALRLPRFIRTIRSGKEEAAE